VNERTDNIPLSIEVALPGDWEAVEFVALLKPRVMSLVVLTAFAGLYLAPGTLHPFIAISAILSIAIGAGASGAINMWYDRDIDAIMSRTCNRPIPAGRVEAGSALGFGVFLAIAAVTVMALGVNWTAAALLALTILFYVFVYTIWLKRRTPQNIVIGGAAGAFPPMVGWAAVTGDISLASITLFAIIFIWTPPHFWALALYRSADYAKAGVPMMPVVAGDRATRRLILAYSLVLAPIGVAPVFIGMASWAYGAVAASFGLAFVALAVAVLFDEGQRQAHRLFKFSIFYLFVLFAALIGDRALGFSG
jgi:protoheme IX farnesyltransferase